MFFVINAPFIVWERSTAARCFACIFFSNKYNSDFLVLSVFWDWNYNFNVPGDPRKCDELIFRITSKVVMIEPSYWMEKKQNCLRIFPISTIWKSDYRSLHNALISNCRQNARKIRKMAFFKLFSGLIIWKYPYNYQNEWPNPQNDTSY